MEESMDLYLDYGKKHRKRRSKKPLILGIILICILVAGTLLFMKQKKRKEEREKLLAQQNQTVTIMFPEGYSIDMMAKRLEEKKIFRAEDFLTAVKKTDQYKNQWIQEIPEKKDVKYRLEGFLYPDTYDIYKKAKPEDLIQKMLDNYESKYQTLKKTYKGKRTLYELATMASIIEREASVEKERVIIAGVIENRLKQNMRLQMCPTVLYVTTKGLYDANKVYYRDLKVDSPYNTYQNKGLPVGPICNAGNSALQAAMNPQKHEYLFYHTDGSGKDTHVFTKTYQEHEDTRIQKDEKD